MPDQLQNARIDQLPQGTLKIGDFLVFRDQHDQITKKCLADEVLSSDTQDFEWQSEANDGDGYAINEVATYGGLWWQSAVNNNLSVPGVDTNWVAIARGNSWQFWAAGAFPETDVFVLRSISGHTYIFQLIDATRPYVSTDFNTELTAGDWKQIASIDESSISTTEVTDIVTIDLLRLVDLICYGSAPIGEAKTWATPVNAVQAKRFTMFFEVSGVFPQTLPSVFKLSRTDNAEYDSGTHVWTPLGAGTYVMSFIKIGANYYGAIDGPNN